MSTGLTNRPIKIPGTRTVVKGGSVVNVIGADPTRTDMVLIETGFRGRLIRMSIPASWLAPKSVWPW